MPNALVACAAVINESLRGGGDRVLTDKDGNYRLFVPSPGIYTVYLKAYEIDPLKTAAADDGMLVEAGKITKSQLQLITGRKVTGKVVDEKGKSYEGLTVMSYSTARPQSLSGVLSTKTNAEGEFEFRLPPGAAYIYASSRVPPTEDNPSGVGLRASVNVVIPAAKTLDPLTLTLSATRWVFGATEWLKNTTKGSQVVRQRKSANVIGTVVDVAGDVIVGAKVFRYNGPILKTNERGDFELKASRGSQFIMSAFQPGYRVWAGTPTAGDELKIVLENKTLLKVAGKGQANIQGPDKGASVKHFIWGKMTRERGAILVLRRRMFADDLKLFKIPDAKNLNGVKLDPISETAIYVPSDSWKDDSLINAVGSFFDDPTEAQLKQVECVFSFWYRDHIKINKRFPALNEIGVHVFKFKTEAAAKVLHAGMKDGFPKSKIVRKGPYLMYIVSDEKYVRREAIQKVKDYYRDIGFLGSASWVFEEILPPPLTVRNEKTKVTFLVQSDRRKVYAIHEKNGQVIWVLDTADFYDSKIPDKISSLTILKPGQANAAAIQDLIEIRLGDRQLLIEQKTGRLLPLANAEPAPKDPSVKP